MAGRRDYRWRVWQTSRDYRWRVAGIIGGGYIFGRDYRWRVNGKAGIIGSGSTEKQGL